MIPVYLFKRIKKNKQSHRSLKKQRFSFLSKTKTAGVTLIELLVVVAMLSVLATIAFVSLQSNPEAAKDVKRLAELGQVGAALEFYYANNGQYPTVTPNPSALTGGDGVNCKPLSEITNELKPYIFPLPVDPDAPRSDSSNILHYRYSVDNIDNPQKYILAANINKNNYNQDHDAFQSTITKADVDEVVSEVGITTNPFCECTEPVGVASDIDTTRTPNNSSYKRFCTGAIYTGTFIADIDDGQTPSLPSAPPPIVSPPQTSNPVTRQCTTGDTTKTAGEDCYSCGRQGSWVCGQNACILQPGPVCSSGQSCSNDVCVNSYGLTVEQRPDQTTFVLQWGARDTSRSASNRYLIDWRTYDTTTSPPNFGDYTRFLDSSSILNTNSINTALQTPAAQRRENIYRLPSGKLFYIVNLPATATNTIYEFKVRQVGQTESAALQIATTPQAPEVRVDATTANSVTLSWSTQSYGGSTSNKYRMWYWKTEDEKRMTPATVATLSPQPTTRAITDGMIPTQGSDKIQDLNATTNEIQIEVPDLDADTHYTFLIQPLASSQSTSQIPARPPIPEKARYVFAYATAKTSIADLQPPTQTINFASVEFSNKLVFYWEKPNRNITGYDVQYCTGTCTASTDESTTTATNKWKNIENSRYVYDQKPSDSRLAEILQRPTSTFSALSTASAAHSGDTSVVVATDLQANKQYKIRIRATGSGGASSNWWNAAGSASATTKQSGPAGFASNNRTTASIGLRWNSVPNANEYEVECIPSSACSKKTLTGSRATTVTGLTAGTTYTFVVRQSKPSNTRDYSSTTATTLFASPPTGVRVAGATVALPAIITTALPPNFASFNPAFNLHILPASRPADYTYENAVSTATSLPIQWNAVSGATGYNVRYRKQGTAAQWVRDGVRRVTIDTSPPTAAPQPPQAIAIDNNGNVFIVPNSSIGTVNPENGVFTDLNLKFIRTGGIHGHPTAMAVHKGRLYINSERNNGLRLVNYALPLPSGRKVLNEQQVRQGTEIVAEGGALPQHRTNPDWRIHGVFLGMTSSGSGPTDKLYGLTTKNLYTIAYTGGRPVATRVNSANSEHGLTNPTALMWYQNKLLAFADGGTKIYQLNPSTGAKQSGGLELSLPTGISLDGATVAGTGNNANYFYGVTKNTTKLYKGAIIDNRYVALTESTSPQEWIWQKSGSISQGRSWTPINASLSSNVCTGPTCSTTISNLDANTVYEIQVQAITSNSTTGWSESLFRPTREFPSVDPTSVSYTTTSKSITVSWDAWNGVAGVSDSNLIYEIDYRTQNQGWGWNPYLISNQTSQLGSCSVADGTVSCKINKQCSVKDADSSAGGHRDAECDGNGNTPTDLTSEIEYKLYIQTKSINNFANRSTSGGTHWIEVIISTDKAPVITSTVQNLATENVAASSMTVKWDKLSSYNYEVQYRAKGETDWSGETENQNTSSISVKLDSLVAGTQYDIRVRAKQTTGAISSTNCTPSDPCVSDWEYTTATTKDVSAPENLRVIARASTSLTVAWDYPYDNYYAEDQFVVAQATGSNAYTNKTDCNPTGIFSSADAKEEYTDHDGISTTPKIKSKVVTVDQLTPNTAYTIMILSRRDISNTNSSCAGATVSGTTKEIPNSLVAPRVNFSGQGAYVGATTATARVTSASAEWLVVGYKLSTVTSFREKVVSIPEPSATPQLVTVLDRLLTSTAYNVRVKAGIGDRASTNFVESNWNDQNGEQIITRASGPRNIRIDTDQGRAITPTSISFQWTGLTGTTVRYEVNYALVSDLPGGWTRAQETGSDTSTADVIATINLPTANEYAIRIRANVDGTFTDWSHYHARASELFEPVGAYLYSPVARSSLATPTLLVGTETHTTLPVSWGTVPNATGYELRYREGTGDYENETLSGNSNTNFTIRGLNQNRTHTVQVRAVNTQGAKTVSEWSSPQTETTASIGSPRLSNPSTTDITQRTIEVSWGAVPAPAGVRVTYDIQYSTSDAFPQNNREQRNTSGTSITLSNLAPGETHFIRARVNRGGGVVGDWSNVLEVTTKTYNLNLQVESMTDTSVTLKWNTNAISGVSGHSVFAIQSSTNPSLLTDTETVYPLATRTTETISNLTPGQTYHFQIAIRYSNGYPTQSAWMPETPVSTKTLLEAPSVGANAVTATPSTLTILSGTYNTPRCSTCTVSGLTNYGFERHNNHFYTLQKTSSNVTRLIEMDTGTTYNISGVSTTNPPTFKNLASDGTNLYTTTNSALYRISIGSTTATIAQVGSATNFGLGSGVGLDNSGLAFHNNKLYMVGSSKLYTLNTTTGIATEVGNVLSGGRAINTIGPLGSLASDGRNLYMRWSGTVYTLNISTREITQVLSTTGNSFTYPFNSYGYYGLTYYNNQLAAGWYQGSFIISVAVVDLTNHLSTDLTFTWTPQTHATGYEAQYGEVESGNVATWITHTPSPITRPPLAVNLEGVPPGTTYRFRVRWLRQFDKSAWSAETTYTTPGTAPSTSNSHITGFKDITHNSLTLDFRPTTFGGTVQQSTSSAFATFTPLTVGAGSPEHPVSSLNAGTRYYFRIQGSSQIVSARTTTTPTATGSATGSPPLSNPTGLKISDNTLSWDPVTGATEYEVDVDVTAGDLLMVGNNRLYALNQTTGRATLINELKGITGTIYGITSHNSALYVVNSNTLYRIDTSGNVESSVSITGASGLQGLASDGTNLYTVNSTTLYRLNANTGVATLITSGSGLTNLTGVTNFDQNTVNVLPATVELYSVGPRFNNRIRQINKSTGIRTDRGGSGTIRNSTGIALAYDSSSVEYYIITNHQLYSFRGFYNRVGTISNFGVSLSSATGLTRHPLISNASSTTITSTNPTVTIPMYDNIRYTLCVRAKDATKESRCTQISHTPYPTSAPISSITPTSTATTKNSISLIWSSTAATGTMYEVQYSSESSFPATNRTTIRTTQRNVTLSNLTAGTQYHIRARQLGATLWSSVISPITAKPSKPTNVRIERGPEFDKYGTKAARATINWDYSDADNPVRFEVQYSTFSDFRSALTTHTVIVPPGSTFEELVHLLPSTTYYVRVRAIGENTNTLQNSDWGTKTDNTTLRFTTPKIPKPVFGIITQVNQNTFTVNYTPGAFPNHKIQYCSQTTTSCMTPDANKADNSIKWSPFPATPITALSLSVSQYTMQVTPSPGVTVHYFRIRNEHGTQISDWAYRSIPNSTP